MQPNENDSIFLGRNDLKDQLSHKILTSSSIPLFLFQGQRRVGKTSLLNFLPVMLDARFAIVHQDMQYRSPNSVQTWLQELRELVGKKFQIDEPTWNPPNDGLEAW